MKVLILGTGWYGCHCASIFLKHNIDFKICDLNNDFFTGSSSKNQNRLHKGFHYNRSHFTRNECIVGFDKFMDKYGNLTEDILKNYYCIDKKSIIDFETYKAIYMYEKNAFEEIEELNVPFAINKKKLNGIIKVDEKFVNFRKAKEYFKELLAPYMIKDYEPKYVNLDDDKVTYKNEEFDYLIDCTYSVLNNTMFHETCISLLYEYKGKPDWALTVMDGPFFSIYPYNVEKRLYTLTDVEYTPYGTIDIKEKIEQKVKTYIKDFDEFFEYNGYFISQKAKIKEANSDDRSMVWEKEGKKYSFSGGKLTGIFSMEDVILDEIIKPM